MNRKKLIPLIVIFLVYLSIETMSFLGLWFVEEQFGVSYEPVLETLADNQKASLRRLLTRGEGHIFRQEPVLGWEPFRRRLNSAGMRDDREYETVPAPESIRISAFGDSFTFASGVKLEESWGKRFKDRLVRDAELLRDPMTQLATHDVTNQPPELVDFNLYEQDAYEQDAALADGFIASRFDATWGRAYGTVPSGLDLDAIVERARPKI